MGLHDNKIDDLFIRTKTMTNNCIFSLEWRRRDNVRIASRRINATLRGFQRHRSGHKEMVKIRRLFSERVMEPGCCTNQETSGSGEAASTIHMVIITLLIFNRFFPLPRHASLPCFFTYIFSIVTHDLSKITLRSTLDRFSRPHYKSRQFPCQDHVHDENGRSSFTLDDRNQRK